MKRICPHGHKPYIGTRCPSCPNRDCWTCNGTGKIKGGVCPCTVPIPALQAPIEERGERVAEHGYDPEDA